MGRPDPAPDPKAPRRLRVAGLAFVGAWLGGARLGGAWGWARGAIVASLVFALGPSECGLESGTKDVGAPCTRDGECLPELVCTSGVCAERSDASMDDGGTAGTTAP